MSEELKVPQVLEGRGVAEEQRDIEMRDGCVCVSVGGCVGAWVRGCVCTHASV